jgi:hypothetical protein
MTDGERQLIDAARERLGPKVVVTDPKEIEPWATDWRGRVHGATPAILSPASTEEVAEIVRLAAELRVPLVPQGGNTGMAAGAWFGTAPVDAADEPDPLDQRREPPRRRRGRRRSRDSSRRGA